MGQPVTVVEKRTNRPDVVRFETNRVLSGMAHEAFDSAERATRPTPVHELVRRLFAHGGVSRVHVNGNVITVQLTSASSGAGLKGVVEELYIYYGEGVEVVIPEGAEA